MALALGGMVCACGQKQADTVNPFMTEFQTPYGTPDFNKSSRHRTGLPILTISSWNTMNRLS